jgi:eukaryotic-like serine/threonine-protein kinase
MRALAGAGHVVADRYRLQDQIGRGAMGAVWQARDELLDRDVAVKELVISPSLNTGDRGSQYELTLYERTLREARTAARLSHPGVVTVYDVVEEDGRPWIIMELVRARSLERVLAEDGPLSPARAADVGQQLISALAAAHAAGVLHRDVKPSNVLLCPDGRAVLTDFGIATLEGDSQLTQAGMVMGTPAFTAPERIRGGPAAPASDFWSLGATLYAAVQGRGPFTERGGPMTTMNAVIHEETPAAPAAGQLAPVIAALMDRDPAARPDAAAATRMLAGAGAGTPAPAAAPWLLDAPRPGSWAIPRPRAAGARPAEPGWPARAPNEAGASRPDAQQWTGDVRTAPGAPGGSPAAAGYPAPDGILYSAPVAQAGLPVTGTAPPAASLSRTAAGPATPARSGHAVLPVAGPATPARSGRAVLPAAGPAMSAAPVRSARPAPGPTVRPGAGPATPAGSGPAPPAVGFRRAGERGRAGAARRRRRATLVACAAAAVVAAGVLGSFAIAHFSGSAGKNANAGTGAGGGKPGAGHGTGAASAGAHASATPQTTLPAGYTWYTLPAATAGTDAGFRTAAPTGWRTARNGLVTYVRNPSGSGFLEVDLTQHTKAGNLAQARWLQVESLRQDRFPGYRRISLRPATVLGSPGAVWTFSWTERGVGRVVAQDYLFSVTARGGTTQSYAVYGSAPAADWPRTATALREAISTFQPLS